MIVSSVVAIMMLTVATVAQAMERFMMDTEGSPARLVRYDLNERAHFQRTYPCPDRTCKDWQPHLLRPMCQGGADHYGNTVYMRTADARRMKLWQCREDWDVKIRRCKMRMSSRTLDCTAVPVSRHEEHVWKMEGRHNIFRGRS